jgi:hypothetical protein
MCVCNSLNLILYLGNLCFRLEPHLCEESVRYILVSFPYSEVILTSSVRILCSPEHLVCVCITCVCISKKILKTPRGVLFWHTNILLNYVPLQYNIFVLFVGHC